MIPPRFPRLSKTFHKAPTPVPEEKVSEPSSTRNPYGGTSHRADPIEFTYPPGDRVSFEKPSRITKSSRLAGASKQSHVLRSALTNGGNAAHFRHHSRTPSIASIDSSKRSSGIMMPPFPVPVRYSSRKLAQSRSEGCQSPTPRSPGAYSRNRGHQRRPLAPRDSLRKVRSAAGMARNGRPNGPPRTRSPMPPSRSDTPQLPPLPKDGLTSPTYVYTTQRPLPYPQHGSRRTSVTGSASISSSVQQSTVVDAIAVTMVGEWMWKYVRRGKHFGDGNHELAADGTVDLTGNGVRHKRWVWLSPYERTVMWSSKQPVSGSALLGKSGRKRESGKARTARGMRFWANEWRKCSPNSVGSRRQGRHADAQGR